MIFDIRFKLKRHQVELDTLLFNEFDSSCLQHGNFSYQFVQQPSCDKFVEFQDFRSFRRIMKWPTSDIVFPWRTQVLVFHEFDIVSNLSNIAATLTFGADVFEWPPIVWSTVVLQATIRFQCAVLLISSSNIHSGKSLFHIKKTQLFPTRICPKSQFGNKIADVEKVLAEMHDSLTIYLSISNIKATTYHIQMYENTSI